MRWLSTVPDWIKGTIALVIAIVGFIAFARDNLYPTITVTAGLVLLSIFLGSLYVAFSKKRSEFGKNGLTWRYPRYRTIALIIIALDLIFSMALVVFKPSRYFIIASFVGTPTPTPTLTSPPIPTSTSTLTPTLSPTSTSTPSPTPITCPYQGMTDNETIVNLIQAEAAASNTEDITIMQSIFAPETVFSDYVSYPQNPPKIWVGPLARYRDDLFPNADFMQVEHFDILPVGQGITGNMAWYTSGGKGFYRINGGEWIEFFNGSLTSIPPTKNGSEHWILKKNSVGCWVITQMEFDAGHVKFPR